MEAPETHPDVSVIVVIRDAGTVAYQTLRCAAKAVEDAAGNGVRAEILVVAGSESYETVARWSEDNAWKTRIVATSYTDPCRCRNWGIRAAKGRFAAFLAGGDLISENWLAAAHAEAIEKGEPCVFHPRWSLSFGTHHAAHVHDAWTEHHGGPLPTPLDPTPWSMTLFGPRTVFQARPFDESSVFSAAARDRAWFYAIHEESVEIHPVPDAVCFLREQTPNEYEPTPRTSVFTPERCLAWLGWNVEEPRDPPSVASGKRKTRRLKRLRNLGLKVFSESTCFKARRILRRVRSIGRRLTLRASGKREERFLEEPLFEQWRAVHAVEPGLFPTPWAVREAGRAASSSNLSTRYLELLAGLPSEPSHVFLVRCVRRGGADRVLLNYLRALAENDSPPVAVVATEPVESDWKHLLPPNVVLSEFGFATADLPEEERIRLLAALLTQTAPSVIHNIHSLTGYEVFSRFGRQLSARSRLFGDFFSAGVTEEGRRLSEAFDYGPRIYPHMTGFLSDHRRFLAGLRDVYGFDGGKLHTVYQPAPPIRPIAENRPEGTFKVLWASRLDPEKRPELLGEIAQELLGEPFEFHAFGAALYRDNPTVFPSLPNLKYHGPFDGFESLRPNEYDAFVYTTLFDGLPNVLLEAAAAGLPLIAPDVGGIRELIVDGETGRLIRDTDDVAGYVAALHDLRSDPEKAGRLVAGVQSTLRDRHSWQAYLAALRLLPGWNSVKTPAQCAAPLRKAS